MIEARSLLSHLRNLSGDHQGMRFSDYQLMGPLNDAISLVYDALIGNANPAARRMVTLTVAGGSAELPEDLHSLSLVDGLLPWSGGTVPPDGYYRVAGDRIYCSDGDLSVEYFYIPEMIVEDLDEVDIPRSLFSTVVNVAKALMMNDYMTADNLVWKVVTSMASRGISHIPDQKVFT